MAYWLEIAIGILIGLCWGAALVHLALAPRLRRAEQEARNLEIANQALQAQLDVVRSRLHGKPDTRTFVDIDGKTD